jgi:hypothetical protein
VLTLDTPTFRELGELVGDGWISTYDDTLTPAMLAEAAKVRPPAGSPDLSEFEWSDIGRSTAEFFHRLASPSGVHHA